MVDDADYDRLKKFFWKAVPAGKTFYAMRKPTGSKWYNWNMYWDIMGKPEKGFVVDHKNGYGLDYQRNNLSIITTRQNAQNKHSKKTSKYCGVSLDKSNKWRAQITVLNEVVYLGTYETEEEAYEVYKSKAELFSEVLDNTPLPIKTEEETDIERQKVLMRKDKWTEEQIKEYFND
jgi:hypothetical protein